MLRFFLRYGHVLLFAVGPLLTYSFSLLDLAGYEPDGQGLMSVGWMDPAPKAEIEMRLRSFSVAIAFGLFVVAGYFDAYRPSRTLISFRHDYLCELWANEWRKTGQIRSSIRMNVMFLGFRSYMPFGQSFIVIWKQNFQPHELDGHIRLYKWQGVCGKAARTRNVLFMDFRKSAPPDDTFAQRWLLRNKFHLFRRQMKRTCHIKAILSVPLFESYGPKGREKTRCVGVINLDATCEKDADYLADNAQRLGVYLAKHGRLIAKMR